MFFTDLEENHAKSYFLINWYLLQMLPLFIIRVMSPYVYAVDMRVSAVWSEVLLDTGERPRILPVLFDRQTKIKIRFSPVFLPHIASSFPEIVACSG